MSMTIDYLALATKYAAERGNNIVLPAGEEDGWHYFAHTRPNLPRYGSLPCAIRISNNGEIEDLDGVIMRTKVTLMAHKLKDMKDMSD